MGKKGVSTGTKSKPKPRIAAYGGLALGALAVGKENRAGTVRVILGPNRRAQADELVADAISDPLGTIAKGGTIAAAGLLISAGADKLGVNKMLAKMRAPVRV